MIPPVDPQPIFHRSPRRFVTCLLTIIYGFGLLGIDLGTSANNLLQTVPPEGGVIALLQCQQFVGDFKLGKPVDQAIEGGQSHCYRLQVAATAQLVHLVVEQHEIDVATTLFGPAGQKITEVDTPNGKNGPEPLWAIAENSGDYQLVVTADSKPARGRYEIRIEELRTATPNDRLRVPGEWALLTANLLFGQGPPFWQAAVTEYEKALKSFDLIPDNSSKAEANLKIGTLHLLSNEHSLALGRFHQVLPIYQHLQDRLGEATLLGLIGQVHQATGDVAKALGSLERARQIAQSLQTPASRPVLAGAIANIGVAYASLGKTDWAIQKYRQALPVFEATGDLPSQATLHLNIGAFYNEQHKPTDALKELSWAMGFYEKLPDSSKKATLIGNIGYAYFLKGNRARALGYYDRALRMCERLPKPDRKCEAIMHNNIGEATASKRKKQSALDSFEKARKIYGELEARTNEAGVLGNIGMLHESLGERLPALNAYEEAIKILEDLRESTKIQEIRESLSEISSPFIYKATMLLMSLGRPNQAFSLSEVAHARTFLDRLGNIRPDLLNMADPQLIEANQDLESTLHLLEQRWELPNNERDVALDGEYAAAQHQYEDLLLRLKVANPNNASSSVRPATLTEVQDTLDNDTTLLSYFVLPEQTFAFIVTRNSFRAVQINLNESYLNRKITWLRRFPNTSYVPSNDLRQLYRRLIAPVRRYLKTRTIGIVPHRELHYLPFAALRDGQHYLSDQYTLFYLPSVSALPLINKRSKPVQGPVLVLAQSRAVRLPSLLHADDEADEVAKLFNTSALKTGKALRSVFLSRAAGSSIIHIAAHADLTAVSPLFYRIMLAKDRNGTAALQVRDIYNLNLEKTNLVVLSACQTNLGGEHNLGDDFVALNRTFLDAGAATVIASLWTVSDKATGILMRSFYLHLREGKSKAEALREAQRETRITYPHPYYWASFVLTGDPGTMTTE